MKNIILILLLLIASQVAESQSSSFESFQAYFKKENLPYLTRHLSNRSIYYSGTEYYNKLPEEISLNHICKGDTSKMTYYYFLPPMEEGLPSEEGYSLIDYFALNKLVMDDLMLIIYASLSEEEYIVCMDVYNGAKVFTHSVVINSYPTPEYNEAMTHTFSLIKEEELIRFTYLDIASLRKRDENNQLLQTEIRVERLINSKDGFHVEKVETMFSINAYMKFLNVSGSLLNDDPLQYYIHSLSVQD